MPRLLRLYSGLMFLAPLFIEMLAGRHWLRFISLPSRLAYLGFLPGQWSLVRDLFSRVRSRSLQ